MNRMSTIEDDMLEEEAAKEALKKIKEKVPAKKEEEKKAGPKIYGKYPKRPEREPSDDELKGMMKVLAVDDKNYSLPADRDFIIQHYDKFALIQAEEKKE
jgi:hypothetical protein